MESPSLVPLVDAEPLVYIHCADKSRAMPIQTISKFQPSTGTWERRRHVRATPNPFLVIRLSSGNTGVVLDVSHEGLGFLASAPVEETQAIHFQISGRATRSSEAAGQLMWKDSTGKRAGLQFTQLPEELRTLIRSCLPAAESPRSIRNEAIRASAQKLDLEEPVRALSPRNPKRTLLVANAVTCALACLIALGIWQSVDRRAASGSSFDWKHSMASWLSYLRAPHGGTVPDTPAQNAEHASVKPQKTAPPSDNADVPFRVAASGQKPPVGLATAASLDSSSKLNSPANLDPPSPSAQPAAASPAKQEPVIAQNSAPPSASEDSGSARLALAQQLLRKDADPEHQAKAAQLLWQAVEKGNVTAEVELAHLYLLGRGVAKSCSQARVLLTAAQSRKSELASKELGDFSQYGCQ
ncbi:MAG: PilZ domain-containing protein [Candidatus Acidiferrales bacterium]